MSNSNNINQIKNLNDALIYIKTELKKLYDNPEIQSFTNIIFQHLLHFSKIDILIKTDTELTNHTKIQIIKIVEQLKKHKPIQYIIGETEFYDLKFTVSPQVLIPRPETEELVKWIIDDSSAKQNTEILDIGTGSGCIAIALAKNILSSQIYAVEKHEGALAIAKQNAKFNNAKINFINDDILNYDKTKYSNKFDVIVSNPPYVRELEKKLMNKNVLDYEPHSALFVSDSNALIFYDAIANFAVKHMKKTGKLYFEINEYLDKQLKDLLLKKGYKNIIVRKDINDRKRMLRAEIIRN
ncbi:MAG: peptide chain release factor N(5)-glutamine methyltransferase [Bacteroidetes bacterium]|nr:MAG: peptide chain release factor N(5)-glutamine methyltransferase [Bacteroidota bacterium]